MLKTDRKGNQNNQEDLTKLDLSAGNSLICKHFSGAWWRAASEHPGQGRIFGRNCGGYEVEGNNQRKGQIWIFIFRQKTLAIKVKAAKEVVTISNTPNLIMMWQ